MAKNRQLQIIGVLWLVCLVGQCPNASAQARENYLKNMLKPNPNSPRDLMELLRNPAVAEEVGVDVATLRQIQAKQVSLYTERRSSPPTNLANPEEQKAFMAKIKETDDAINEMIKGALEELLPPEKLERLKQIAYRYEIQKMGFAGSLSEGWLADVVEMHDAQYSTLMRKIGDIEVETQKKIDQLRSAAEEEVLAQLSPEQRKNVRNALGEPLKYRLLSSEELIVRQTRDMLKKGSALTAPKKY